MKTTTTTTKNHNSKFHTQMASIAMAITNTNSRYKPTRPSTITNNSWKSSTKKISIGGHQQQQALNKLRSINKKHLTARVKTITGKLLESHGAELRRTLFSLGQIFQDDSELAAEFIESDGLECLMKVAVDADQIHQNYILRALGQLIALPNGMNGLARHNETIRWLYTLLASQHQLVVKTSIKLLILFVENSESNSLQFGRIIRLVDESKDQETFYKLLAPLEELGINKIIENCSNLDVQLKKQFQLYEEQVVDKIEKTRFKQQNSDNNNTNSLDELMANNNMDNNMATESINSPNSNHMDHARRRRLRQQTPVDSNGDDDDNDNNNIIAESTGADDNYESANESYGSQIERQTTNTNDANAAAASSSDADSEPTHTPPHPREANKNNINVKRQQLQQQQQRQQQNQHQQAQQPQRREQATTTNIARGKQQRASISSCSSSDSYASYGSGYASGSGNSTDHELKQRSLNNAMEAGMKADERQNNKSNAGGGGRPHNRVVSSASHNNEQEDEDDDDDEEEEEEEEEDDDEEDDNGEDDDDSQLKQHLSELEQLTDELASRNIFGILSEPLQSTSKHHHLSTSASSSSIINKSSTATSSKSSSILSTGSNNIAQSLTPTIDEDSLPAANSENKLLHSSPHPQTPSSLSTPNNESRSTSATPTSTIQPSSTSSTTMAPSPAATAASYSQAFSSRQTNSNNASEKTTTTTTTTTYQQAQVTKRPNAATNQYTMLPPTTKSQQQTNVSTTPNSNATVQPTTTKQQQEPYYHNLFQWEQLVSKGVTRPLLINDLDFTDLRDEDDCDLLMSNNSFSGSGSSRSRTNQVTGEPLTINIPGAQQQIQSSLNTLGENDSPKSRAANSTTPASAPPPLPPPPISPWFNTIAGSRPQSQFMSSPSPPFEYGPQQQQQQQSTGEFQREQSPANYNYNTSYGRNSVCMPQTSTPTRETAAHQVQYNTLQPITSLRSASSMSSLLFGNSGKYANGKRKKTMKLFWKEVREDRSLLSKLTKKRTIWDEIKPVQIDTQKLEYLFESKAKDLMLSKSRLGLDGVNQRKVKITVLDAKRSNAINIGMTKLPPMRTIKSAILKMDSSIMNREGIEKILTTMMPSEEEKSRIIEAQLANPDTPLGTAEQFLLNLASISALEARLKLWAFQLDYAQIEKEVADPLMDLKQAIEEIERSETFRIVLGTLLAIGNFLNSTNVKGFQIDYLEKVPEVKDTVHKHSLLHHLCLFIQDKFDPQLTSDLYSEFSAVNRASKVDYTEVAKNLKKMQQDCKSSWDYLKIVAKHDGLANLMNTSCSSSSSSSSSANADNSSTSSSIATSSVLNQQQQQPRSAGKLNNLSKLSMITTVMSSETSSGSDQQQQMAQQPNGKQLKTKVSDFLTDCAERIMVLMVIHRRVMNRFQKLLVYLGCPAHQIKQTQPQQILKIINEFALEYRTKRERVREMLLKKQQCHHHHHQQHHHLTNRWQLSRSRWAGSQQCIDSLGYNHHQRPCSTTSSCASSYAPNSTCGDSMCTISSLASDSRHHHGNQQHQLVGSGNRASSPSGYSQISNYSDYLFDQSCCNSRQQSVTPVPSEKGLNQLSQQHQHLIRRPHSMSISMFDLQNQQNLSASNVNNNNNTAASGSYDRGNQGANDDDVHQKDEQLRRLLGAGKSLDGACHELYQMSHWSSTMARVTRHPPSASQGMLQKQRAISIDPSGKSDELDAAEMAEHQRRQSSYYRYLHNGQCSLDDDTEQNSDDEILQSLVRTATAKSSHSTHHGSHSSSSNRSAASGSHSSANKGAKSKILSRFSCDRKSLRRTMRSGIELSNVS